ncbi:serine hydrolase BPHL-like isoform X2 [Ciona intestinalis]
MEINDVKLCYKVIGSGDHVVLLMPGAAASCELSLNPQLEGLDQNIFTLVAFDPRGWGWSMDARREYKEEDLITDAEDAAALMERLGFEKYSVFGFCWGGNIALKLASTYNTRVIKLVVSGAFSLINRGQMQQFEHLFDIRNWSPRILESFQEFYGADYSAFDHYVRFVESLNFMSSDDGMLFTVKELNKISACTMLHHGNDDELTGMEQAKHLQQTISGSSVVHWENAAHFLHLQYASKFNEMLQQFLLS